MLRPSWLRSAALLSATLTAACGGDDPVGPADVAGTYALTGVKASNFDALPIAVSGSAGAGFTVLTGQTLVLRAGGTLERTDRLAKAGAPLPDQRATGTWALDGGTLVLTFTPAAGAEYVTPGPFRASVQGGTRGFRYVEEGKPFVGRAEWTYERQ